MKKIAVFLILISMLLHTVALVKADAIADPNDLFDVNYPLPNQQVKGTIPIKFRIFDNQQASVSYNVKLFDFATCRDSYLGDISSGTATSNKNTDFLINWNTKATSTIPTLNDGNYCIRVCVAMVGQTTPYTACNGRFVRVSNNNRLPLINTKIPAITIKESESWQYQVKASDPDGDSLKYYLIKSAFFLQINQNTGVISTNSLSKKLPDNVARVDYNITYAVDDNMSGQVYQDFTISVVRDQPLVQPTSAPGTTVPGPVVNNPSEIKIVIPNKNTLFRDKENTIKWEVSDQEGIKSIKLSYSKDQSEWIEITTLDKDQIEYVWDVSGLEDESYYLQLSIEDNQGVTTTKVSDKFAIQNKPDLVSNPLIVSIKPENNEVTEARPTISGELVPSNDSTIDKSTLKIKIEDWDITSLCKVEDDNKFICKLDKDLEPGLHKLSIEFEDSNGMKANSESVFKVRGEVASYPNSFPVSFPEGTDTINLFGRDYPRHLAFLVFLLCCSCLILLLAPLMLISIWSERRKKVIATSKPTPLKPEELKSSYQAYIETPAPIIPMPVPTVTTNYIPQTEGLNAENTYTDSGTFAASESSAQPNTYTEPSVIDTPIIPEKVEEPTKPEVQTQVLPVIVQPATQPQPVIETKNTTLPAQVNISDVAKEQDALNNKEFDPESFEKQWQQYYNQSEALTKPSASVQTPPAGSIEPPQVVTDSQGNVDYSKMVDDLYKPRTEEEKKA